MVRAVQFPDKQTPLTRFALEHPVRLAGMSGLLIFVWTAAIVPDLRAMLAAGGATTILVWFLWSKHGPFRRMQDRVYDESGERRNDS
jgi:hypothetical protein